MHDERMIKNILVTGGAGFIGSAFIRCVLQKQDFAGTIVNVDALTYAGNLENLQDVEKDVRYGFEHGDICDEILIEGLIEKYQIDTIIHLAAESHVDRSILGPKAFMETNVMGTFHLLEVVRRHPSVHFHHVSTDEVYGCLGDEGFFTETTPYSPNSPYSTSKAASDHLVRAYAKTYGLSVCISNCSNNYGPYQFPEKLIPLMIKNCLAGNALPIYGEGKNVRDWLFVDDHAQALWLLLHKGKKGETYNIGGGAERKNIEIVHEIIKGVSEITGKAVEQLNGLITYVKDRPGHDWRYAIDCTKIQNELGWYPEHNFENGLKDTIAWYIEHSDWVANIESGAYRKWLQENYNDRLVNF